MATQRELLTGCRPCGYILYTVEGGGRVWRGVPRSVVPVQGAERGGGGGGGEEEEENDRQPSPLG